MHILLPRATADRRQAAHLADADQPASLCGMRARAGCEVLPDTRQTRDLLEWRHCHICGLCLDILRRRAQAAETAQREAERKAHRKPTKHERDLADLARWIAAATLAAKPAEHDEDHTTGAPAVIQ